MICEEDKSRIVAELERGDDYLQLAEQLRIQRSTVYAVVRRSQQSSRAGTWASFRLKKVDEARRDEEMETAFTDIVDEHQTFMLDQFKRELYLRPVSYTHLTLPTILLV